MKRTTFNSLLAITAIGLSASASASTITNLDLITASPFGGFDWSQNGTAVSTPGPVYSDGDVITTYYFADAVAVNKEGGGVFSTPDLLTSAPGGVFGAASYEYTIFASITEVVSGCGGVCAGAATFTPTGGAWNVYYDHALLSNTVANQISGTGFTDGDFVIGGTILAGGGGTFNPTTGVGIFSFDGIVTSTNSTYISPDQDSTFAIATLQFGNSTTNWTAPTGTPLGGLPASAISFQADGNQGISVIPEPGILALLGLGMFGLFVTTQKKRA